MVATNPVATRESRPAVAASTRLICRRPAPSRRQPRLVPVVHAVRPAACVAKGKIVAACRAALVVAGVAAGPTAKFDMDRPKTAPSATTPVSVISMTPRRTPAHSGATVRRYAQVLDGVQRDPEPSSILNRLGGPAQRADAHDCRHWLPEASRLASGHDRRAGCGASTSPAA